MIADGALGDVRLITGGYLQDWLLYDTDWSWRLEREQGGDLRVIGDIGSHWLDLMSFLTGHRVEAVMADLTTFMPIRREPVGHVETFSHDAPAGDPRPRDRDRGRRRPARPLRGRRARRRHALAGLAPAARTTCTGKSTARRRAPPGAPSAPEELWVGHRDRPSELTLRDPGQMAPHAAAHTRMPAGHSEGFGETFRELYRSVYAAVAAGEPPAEPDYPTFADGHEQALIGDAIARSHAEGRWVEVTR